MSDHGFVIHTNKLYSGVHIANSDVQKLHKGGRDAVREREGSRRCRDGAGPGRGAPCSVFMKQCESAWSWMEDAWPSPQQSSIRLYRPLPAHTRFRVYLSGHSHTYCT